MHLVSKPDQRSSWGRGADRRRSSRSRSAGSCARSRCASLNVYSSPTHTFMRPKPHAHPPGRSAKAPARVHEPACIVCAGLFHRPRHSVVQAVPGDIHADRDTREEMEVVGKPPPRAPKPLRPPWAVENLRLCPVVRAAGSEGPERLPQLWLVDGAAWCVTQRLSGSRADRARGGAH